MQLFMNGACVRCFSVKWFKPDANATTPFILIEIRFSPKSYFSLGHLHSTRAMSPSEFTKILPLLLSILNYFTFSNECHSYHSQSHKKSLMRERIPWKLRLYKIHSWAPFILLLNPFIQTLYDNRIFNATKCRKQIIYRLWYCSNEYC